MKHLYRQLSCKNQLFDVSHVISIGMLCAKSCINVDNNRISYIGSQLLAFLQKDSKIKHKLSVLVQFQIFTVPERMYYLLCGIYVLKEAMQMYILIQHWLATYTSASSATTLRKATQDKLRRALFLTEFDARIADGIQIAHFNTKLIKVEPTNEHFRVDWVFSVAK